MAVDVGAKMTDLIDMRRGTAGCVLDLGHLVPSRYGARRRERPAIDDPRVLNGHASNVRDMATTLADALGIRAGLKRAVRLGALLHDLGKVAIDDAILHKPGPLTRFEWEVMRRHPGIGYDMLRGIDDLAAALPVVRHHHERWDGGGYPDRLAGDDIPVAARIVAVCDAFDAMTSDRVYRRALAPDDACDEISARAGEQFDPRVADVFLDLVGATRERLGRAG